MDRLKTVYYQLVESIKQKENHVPREYETIGGMWTVDTYKKGDVTLQVMDEGYTIKVVTNGVCLVDSVTGLKLIEGSIEDVEGMLKAIN